MEEAFNGARKDVLKNLLVQAQLGELWVGLV
jgi:hypothetical protein